MTARRTFLVCAAVLSGAVAVALLTRASAITASHPAYLAALALAAVAAAVFVVLGVRSRSTRGGRWRLAGRIVLVLAVIGAAAGLLWLRPFTATDTARRALEPGGGVTVTESATRIRFRPAGAPKAATLVFVPGARVDPRAYAATLRPIAEAGFPVVVVKPPLGVGLLARGAAADEVRRAARDGQAAAVGGHSLGGTAAAMVVQHERAADGLLLWASYPANDALAGRSDLVVTSISGSRDGLATPADIADSRSDLPPDTRFVVIPGAVHADFGDYGTQRGDGERAISHAAAQRELVAASLRFMREVLADGPD